MKQNKEKTVSGKHSVFINYRRKDSSDAAAYLRSYLVKRFGADSIFQDINSIELGDNFPNAINNAIAATNVFISIIGKSWLSVKDARGKLRINNPKDYVRMEIEAAIRFEKIIIPVFIDGAKMPYKKDLPKSIEILVDYDGMDLTWINGMDKLNKRIFEIEKEINNKRKVENAKKKSIEPENRKNCKWSHGEGR